MPKQAKARPTARSQEARDGRLMISYEVSAEARDAIDRATRHLQQLWGVSRCTKVQALEWLIGQGAAAIPK